MSDEPTLPGPEDDQAFRPDPTPAAEATPEATEPSAPTNEPTAPTEPPVDAADPHGITAIDLTTGPSAEHAPVEDLLRSTFEHQAIVTPTTPAPPPDAWQAIEQRRQQQAGGGGRWVRPLLASAAALILIVAVATALRGGESASQLGTEGGATTTAVEPTRTTVAPTTTTEPATTTSTAASTTVAPTTTTTAPPAPADIRSVPINKIPFPRDVVAPRYRQGPATLTLNEGTTQFGPQTNGVYAWAIIVRNTDYGDITGDGRTDVVFTLYSGAAQSDDGDAFVVLVEGGTATPRVLGAISSSGVELGRTVSGNTLDGQPYTATMRSEVHAGIEIQDSTVITSWTQGEGEMGHSSTPHLQIRAFHRWRGGRFVTTRAPEVVETPAYQSVPDI